MRASFLGGLLALATLASACSSPAALRSPDEADGSGRTAELEALYWARIDSSKTRFTDADVRYMVGMIGHHAQAIVMSAHAPTNGASPAVQRLAARIDNAQRDEIRSMQRWLRDRGQPAPEVDALGRVTMPSADPGAMDHSTMDHAAMDHSAMGHGGMDHAGMPGMLSQAQLDELAAARGTDFDRLYLTYMIQHHGGAVVMVDELFATDGAAQDDQAFKLASDVQVDQRTEIARMQQMLDALPPLD